MLRVEGQVHALVLMPTGELCIVSQWFSPKFKPHLSGENYITSYLSVGHMHVGYLWWH